MERIGEKMFSAETQEITEGERRVLEVVKKGVAMPTEIAKTLRISTSAVSQQLKKLVEKGILSRRRLGRSIHYDLLERGKEEIIGEIDLKGEEREGDWELIRESYEALSRVWSHVLKLNLSPDELKKLRSARNLLEDMLHERRLVR